jgi:hypothetical protein
MDIATSGVTESMLYIHIREPFIYARVEGYKNSKYNINLHENTCT